MGCEVDRRLLALLGAYLLLNTMILSASPPRIIYHDLVISVILVVCAIVYGYGKGQSTLPWVFFVLGAYLLIAPVFLWAPEGVQFLNHTVVGIPLLRLGDSCHLRVQMRCIRLRFNLKGGAIILLHGASGFWYSSFAMLLGSSLLHGCLPVGVHP